MATTREELRRGNDSSAIWSLLTWQAGEEVESESCSDGSDGEEVSVVQALDVAGQSCSCEERVEEGKEEEVSDDADTAEEDNTVMREVQCDEHGEPILVLCKPVEASNGAESFTDPVLCYAYPVQPGDEVTAPPTPKPKRKPKPKTKPKGKPKRKGRSAPWRQRKKGGQKSKPALVPPAGVFLDLQEKQEALKQAAGGDAKAVEQKRRRKRRSRKEIEARMRAEEPVDPAKLQENYEKRCRSRLQRRLRRADEQRESLPAVELTDSRDRGSSWVSMHTGKPPFDTGYGRGNQSPVRGGFIDGEYMTTYNVAPEVAPNKPKTPQLRRSTRHRLHTMNREGRTPALWSRSPHKSKNKSRRPVSSRAYHLPHASWKPGMKVRAPSLLHLNFSSTHPNFDQPAPLAGAGLGGGGTEDAVFVPMVASQPRRAAAASNIQALEEQWSAYNQRRSSLDLADVGWL